MESMSELKKMNDSFHIKKSCMQAAHFPAQQNRSGAPSGPVLRKQIFCNKVVQAT
jgi:hypothetical protein